MDKPEERSARELSAIRNYPLLVRRYARLLEVASNLASTLELDVLLRRIVDAARELTGCEEASLLLYEEETHRLYFEAATTALAQGAFRQAVPVDKSLAGWIYTHAEPLLVEDVLSDPRFYREVDAITHFQTRSLLGVPLQTKNKTLGVIEAVNKIKGVFDEQDMRLLQALAAQAAVGIENSRLFQQSDVVAEMVHELRTPLSSLLAGAHLLQRPELPAAQRDKMAQSIYAEVLRLNEMASDFLDLARLESGRMRFTREPVHLGGLVHECLEIVRPYAEAERIRLEAEIDPSLAPVQADRNRLKQLLLNLVNNAIKYNHPEGRVLVGLRREGEAVVLTVRDTGRGIPPEGLTRVFERFYRVPDQEGQVSGTGLGLAIAKRIAEGSGGSIEVQSRLGEGSTFTVRLPAQGEGRPASD